MIINGFIMPFQPDDATLAQFGLNAVQQQQQQHPQHMTESNLKTNDNQTNNMYRESRGNYSQKTDRQWKIVLMFDIWIGRSVGVGPMRRPADRKIDTSPYSSGNVAYLSPPSDSSWRRTSSDSAIHQSLQQNQVNLFYLLFTQQNI